MYTDVYTQGMNNYIHVRICTYNTCIQKHQIDPHRVYNYFNVCIIHTNRKTQQTREPFIRDITTKGSQDCLSL